MKIDAKNLKINSIALIILAIADAVALIGQFLANQISVETLMEKAQTTAELANISIAIVVGVSCLLFFVTLIVGLRGISQANGKCSGGANVGLAIFLLVINILCIAAQVYYLIQGQLELMPLIQSLLYVSFLVPYIMCAKKVK